jgi:hypothetical protein
VREILIFGQNLESSHIIQEYCDRIFSFKFSFWHFGEISHQKENHVPYAFFFSFVKFCILAPKECGGANNTTKHFFIGKHGPKLNTL